MLGNNKIKVTLISPYQSIDLIGLRTISSYLKQYGHETNLIFLNLPDSSFASIYSEEVVTDVIDLCKDSDLIGISLMTNYFVRVKDLTSRIKNKVDIPVIWGGIHPTVRPDECIRYADMVCVGEGEDAMLELAEKLKNGIRDNIKNIWFRRNNDIIKNELRPLEQNLDKYPSPDYDMRDHYIMEADRVVRMSEEHLRRATRLSEAPQKPLFEYMVLTTRNCPHSCSYCCNNALRKIYGERVHLVRKRNIEGVIRELEFIKSKFRFIQSVLIADETFFVRNNNEIKEFCDKYKARINLPMVCILSPLEINEGKLELMIEAGLHFVCVGIQSYNQRTLLDLYSRRTSQEAILKSVEMLEKYKEKIPHPQYLFIVDNPFETKKSLFDTMRFITYLPEGAAIILFPLVLFPGTELYERAKKKGLIDDEIKDVYLKNWGMEDVKQMDSITRIMYFHRYVRAKSANTESMTARIVLKCRKTVFFYVFYAFYYVIFYVITMKRVKQLLALIGLTKYKLRQGINSGMESKK